MLLAVAWMMHAVDVMRLQDANVCQSCKASKTCASIDLHTAPHTRLCQPGCERSCVIRLLLSHMR